MRDGAAFRRDAKAFRPAPACPGRRGSAPASQARASRGFGLIRLRWRSRARAGETYTFPCPARPEGLTARQAPFSARKTGQSPCGLWLRIARAIRFLRLAGALSFSRHPGEGHSLRHSQPCPPDRPGRQSVPASARPALGGRFSPAGSGAGLLGFAVWPLPAGAGAHGRGKRMRFLFPPGLREACQGARWASDRKGATGRTQRWATAHPTVVGWANAHRFRRGGLPPILRDTQVALANAPGTGPHGGLPPTLQAPRWGGPLSRHQMVGNRPPCRRVRTRPHTTPPVRWVSTHRPLRFPAQPATTGTEETPP